MEIIKPPDAFSTSENGNRQENRSLPLIGKATSIFSVTQEFKVPGIQSYIAKVLDSFAVLVIMLLVTFYTLFSDDIRISSFPISADDVFFGLSCCAFGFFSIELILSFISKPEYRWGFYFWLDLIATLSIIPDIDWIWNPIIGVGSSSSNVNQVQNAGKQSRAGTKATRVIRIVRLVRLMRIAKLYKHAKRALKNDSIDKIASDTDLQIPKESRVGRKLSDLITKRVIVIVMIILLLIPMFDLSFFLSPTYSWDYGLSAINDDLYSMNGDPKDVILYYQNYYVNDTRPLVYMNFTTGESYGNSTDIDNLRYIERYYASTNNSVAIFDIRYDTRLDAELSICKTIFVCIVLVVGAIVFTKDVNDFAIIPIEKMIIKVKKIAANPLKIAEEKLVDIYDIIQEESKRNCWEKLKGKPKTKSAEYETTMLENTIVKIGVLLALGFGEAGAAIISANIKSGGDVDPLIKGNKIAAIFGFCDIRNFTDATEELQEGVMVFVNELARIVHSTIDHFGGAANKNIGDAFLLVWKFDPNEIEDLGSPIVFKKDSKEKNYLGDLALTSFLKIMVKINKDPCVLKYRNNQKLVKRMPGYQVKFGFGLHIGWAIEGAIGSQFKIDASYLSHHVNMSANLEGLTKTYGIPLLLTNTVYDILSSLGKKYCRHVDTIAFRGRDIYRLYTSDADFSSVLPGKFKDNSKERTKNKRKTLKFRLEQGVLDAVEILESSKEISLIKKHFSDEFFEVFESSLEMYLLGKWKEAKEGFERVLKIRNDDGPSKSLIAFMQEYNFVAPNDWNGVRTIY